jgi:signal peptidase II
VLQLSHVRNTGAAFSLFQEEPIGLLVVSCVLYVLVLLYSVRKPHLSRLETLSLGIILGGAGGNLLDRVLWGGVVDYIDVVAIHYPVFNLADTAIVFGMLGLVLASL